MNYVTKVADEFLKLHPEIPFLSASDYTAIAEWEKEEIPLRIVLTAINEGGANSEIESVTYFQEKIQKKFLSWLQTQPAEF